jgi:hypothetical protein
MWFLIISFLVSVPVLTENTYANVGQKALKVIEWDWQSRLPDWTIRFGGKRSGFLAMSNSDIRVIDVWIRKDQTLKEIASIIVHEASHAYEKRYFTDEMRKTWMKIRSMPVKTQWSPSCILCSDYKYGVGDLAESISWTLLSPETGFKSKLGPPPNKAQQTVIRQWLGIQ